LLDAKPGERVLDLGCGTGHLAAKIAEAGAQVVGVDRSHEMIRQARLKYPSLRFEVMDAREISLDGTFDAVFSNATLHWIKEPERVIAAVQKSLRPRGRLVAEFGGKGNTAELLRAVQKAWAKLGIAGPPAAPVVLPDARRICWLAGATRLRSNPRVSLRPAPPRSTMASAASAIGSKCSAAPLSTACRKPPASACS